MTKGPSGSYTEGDNLLGEQLHFFKANKVNTSLHTGWKYSQREKEKLPDR